MSQLALKVKSHLISVKMCEFFLCDVLTVLSMNIQLDCTRGTLQLNLCDQNIIIEIELSLHHFSRDETFADCK
jgi:hypothetical protein